MSLRENNYAKMPNTTFCNSDADLIGKLDTIEETVVTIKGQLASVKAKLTATLSPSRAFTTDDAKERVQGMSKPLAQAWMRWKILWLVVPSSKMTSAFLLSFARTDLIYART